MKKLLSITLTLAMVVSLFGGLSITAEAAWDGSTTTAVTETAEDGSGGAGYYLVDTAEKLAWIAAQVDGGKTFSSKTVLLTADIDLENNTWTPIGNSTACCFNGTFDGGKYDSDGNFTGCHTISGISISTSADYQGLFGVIGSSSTVKNVGVINSDIISGDNSGGVVGLIQSGTVDNCYNAGSITSNYRRIGGIAGCNDSGTIKNCYNIGSITSNYDNTGGIAGYNDSGTVENCYNAGSVTSTKDKIGGIVGYNDLGIVTSCYNIGVISGSYNIGGVIGYNDGGTVTSCCYDKQMCTYGGIANNDTNSAKGLLTGSMATATAYDSNWGTDDWNFTDGLYPRLKGMDTTAAAYVSASPITLESTDDSKYETVKTVSSNFTVSTDNSVAWTSSPSGMISISGGDATVESIGSVTLTASYGGVSRTVPIETAQSYSVTVSSNMTVESGSTGENAAYATEDYELHLTTPDFGYSLPDTITVKIDGTEATQGTDYDWDSASGYLIIHKDSIIGNIEISGTAALNYPTLVQVAGLTLYSTTSDDIYTQVVHEESSTIYTLDCSEIPGGSGTAVYDSSTGTLAFHNAVVPSTSDSDYYSGFYTDGGELTLELNGDSVFGISGDTNTIYDYYIKDGSVKVEDGSDAGIGSLTVYSYKGDAYEVYGLRADDNIYFESGSYNFIGSGDSTYVYGLFAGGDLGDLYIDGGKLNISITGNVHGDGIFSNNNTKITGGSIVCNINANDGSSGIESCDTEITGGSIVCTANGSGDNCYGIYCDHLIVSGGSISAEGSSSAIRASLVTYNGTNTILHNTNPAILAASTAAGALSASDLSGINFSNDHGIYKDSEDNTITYIKIGRPVTSITVTGAHSATKVTNGSTLQMSASVLPTDALDRSVTWSAANGTGSATIDSPTGLLTATGVGTVTVTATANDGSGRTGSAVITVASTSSTSSSSSGSTVTIPISDNAGTVKVNASVSGSTAKIAVTDAQLQKIASSAQTGTVKMDVSSLKVNTVVVPSKVITAVGSASGSAGIEMILPTGTVTFDKSALAAVTGKGDVKFSVETVSNSKLTDTQRSVLGSQAGLATVVDVNVYAGSSKVSTFGDGKLTVSVPYTLKAGENADNITVWFLNDDGTIEPKNGVYSAATRCVEFTTNHLSQYLIVNFPFADVAEDAWYYGSVAYAYNNGLFAGTSDMTFSPGTAMTRQMIWMVLARMDGKTYANMAEAKAWAVENGISDGSNPTGTITRQQMAAILYRYAQYKGYDTTQGGMVIREFADYDSISNYALTAMGWTVNAGLLKGSDNKLMPAGSATRAQVATILQRFCQNVAK